MKLLVPQKKLYLTYPRLVYTCVLLSRRDFNLQVVRHVRACLASPNRSVYEGGVDAVIHLSRGVGPYLNPHVTGLLPSLSKMKDKMREKVREALETLEAEGGKEVGR